MLPAMNVALAERQPDRDENFLNSDFSALVCGNNVITYHAGRNAGSLCNYLHGLFRAAALPNEATMFDLVRMANVDQLRKIDAAGGVSSIQLDLGIEEAAAALLQDQGARPGTFGRLTQQMVDVVDCLLRAVPAGPGLAESGRGKVRLSISVPDGDVVPAKDAISSVAAEIVEDEDADDFVITLRNGDTIKHGEISTKKLVSLHRAANSVNRDEVWEEMVTFLRELRRAGLLE